MYLSNISETIDMSASLNYVMPSIHNKVRQTSIEIDDYHECFYRGDDDTPLSWDDLTNDEKDWVENEIKHDEGRVINMKHWINDKDQDFFYDYFYG